MFRRRNGNRSINLGPIFYGVYVSLSGRTFPFFGGSGARTHHTHTIKNIIPTNMPIPKHILVYSTTTTLEDQHSSSSLAVDDADASSSAASSGWEEKFEQLWAQEETHSKSSADNNRNKASRYSPNNNNTTKNTTPTIGSPRSTTADLQFHIQLFFDQQDNDDDTTEGPLPASSGSLQHKRLHTLLPEIPNLNTTRDWQEVCSNDIHILSEDGLRGLRFI